MTTFWVCKTKGCGEGKAKETSGNSDAWNATLTVDRSGKYFKYIKCKQKLEKK